MVSVQTESIWSASRLTEKLQQDGLDPVVCSNGRHGRGSVGIDPPDLFVPAGEQKPRSVLRLV